MSQVNKEDPTNPRHYIDLASEPIDAIEGWDLGFHLGNAVKYIAHAGRKTADALIDLEKARWYLDRKIQNIKKGLK
jgi:hypothetical protein